MSDEFQTKECNECEQELPLFDFGFSPSRGTYFPKCKECTKNRRKRWYKKDPNLSHGAWGKRKVWEPKS